MAKVVWRDKASQLLEAHIDYIWDMRMKPAKLRKMKFE